MTTQIFTAQNLIHELLPNPGVSAQTQAVTTSAALPSLNAGTDVVMITTDGTLRYTLDGSTPTVSSLEIIYEGFPVYWNKTTYAAAKVIAESGTVNVRVSELIYPTSTARRAADLSSDLDTSTFDRVYNRLLREMQLNPDTAVLDASQQEEVAEKLMERMRTAYEYTWWPFLTIVEERDTTDTGAGVYVPFSGSGLINLGEIRSITRGNPHSPDGNTRQLGYDVRRDGIWMVGTSLPDSVYVDYRLRPPQFTRVAYSGATAYSPGDLVYYSTTGQCYMAIQAGTGNAPTNTAYWEVQEIPRTFENYLVRGAFGDWLNADGQYARSAREDARAEAEIERIYDVHKPQQGQHEAPRIRTAW